MRTNGVCRPGDRSFSIFCSLRTWTSADTQCVDCRGRGRSGTPSATSCYSRHSTAGRTRSTLNDSRQSGHLRMEGEGRGSCNPSIRHEKTLTSEHPQTVGVAAVTLTGSQRRPGSPPGPPGFAALQAPPLRLLLQLRLRERRHGLWDPARTAHLGGAGGGRQGCCGSVRGCRCQP